MAGCHNFYEEHRLMLDEQLLEEQRLQREEQRLQRELEERPLALEERKMEMQMIAAERHYSQKESVAMKLKTWGEAKRNTFTKTPVEPIEMVTWFFSGWKVCLISPKFQWSYSLY